jgi:hypothetical protein
MRRTSVDFFRLTGGFRVGETQEELKRRIAEIVDLETTLRGSNLRMEEAERVRRRLRELKDADFIIPC